MGRKRKQSLGKIFIAAVLLIMVASFGITVTDFKEDPFYENYVSKNEVMSELQFSVYSTEEWQDFFAGYKETYLTGEMVSDLLRQLGVSEVIAFEYVKSEKRVSRTEWNKIYEQLTDYLDLENQIRICTILVLASETENGTNQLETNLGTIATGLPVTSFEDWESYTIYMFENECVGIKEKAAVEQVIANTYIIDATEKKLTFLFEEKVYEKEVLLQEVHLAGSVADITVSGKQISAIAQKKDFIEGALLSYDDTTIEIEGYGRIAHDKKLPVYRTDGVAEQLRISDIILGNMEVKYIIGTNEVCAILLMSPAEISKVRVLLLAQDGGKFRNDVYVMASQEVQLSCGDRKTTLPAGAVLDAADYLNQKEETILLDPLAQENLFYICTENGEVLSNGYSGKIEIRQYEGGYCIVNEVDLETYLYSVVPSEMPSNYQPEALRAQAVCARSYAYMQVLRSDLAAYGAHIDDSSSYQVYNQIAKTESSIRAVEETAGLVMQHNGSVIEAYYFSTSMGYTDTELVWNPAEENASGYLKSVCLNRESFAGDLSDNTVFKEYLMAEADGYDSDIKFYRWQANADYSEKTEEIKNILEVRRQAAKRHITYYEADGTTEAAGISGFGKIVKIEVAKRSTSGCILELQVVFEHGTAKVKNEYNIRKVLAAGMTGIVYQDGSKGAATTLLPSAFCTVEKQNDGTYLLCGGGYGHGIGMSQNGANGMAKEGYTYADILNYFYKEIELVDIRI